MQKFATEKRQFDFVINDLTAVPVSTAVAGAANAEMPRLVSFWFPLSDSFFVITCTLPSGV
jgi:hypothetical protein